jgi:hypothetical protein
LINNLKAVKDHYTKWKKTINVADERGFLPEGGFTSGDPQALTDDELKKALGL